MTRTLCILAGIFLTLSPFLPDRIGDGTDPDRARLALALGGDPNNNIKSVRCDGADGLKGGNGYVGCQAVGGPCTQCVNQAADGSFPGSTYNKVVSAGTVLTLGYMERPDLPDQSCGNVFNGTCIKDANSPSGFSCQGTMTNTTCGVAAAVAEQPTPVTGTINPTGP